DGLAPERLDAAVGDHGEAVGEVEPHRLLHQRQRLGSLPGRDRVSLSENAAQQGSVLAVGLTIRVRLHAFVRFRALLRSHHRTLAPARDNARVHAADVVIRPRTMDDLTAVVDALTLVARSDGYPSRWPEDPVSWLRTTEVHGAWIADRGGEVLGHIVLRPARS